MLQDELYEDSLCPPQEDFQLTIALIEWNELVNELVVSM